MTDYGRTTSTVKPKPIDIDEYNVWVSANIRAVSENIGRENEFIGYEYNLKRYGKDEYILQHSSDIEDINAALCELAGIIGGE